MHHTFTLSQLLLLGHEIIIPSHRIDYRHHLLLVLIVT